MCTNNTIYVHVFTYSHEHFTVTSKNKQGKNVKHEIAVIVHNDYFQH